MALTGQQAGAVNLRLEMSTWLRPADAAASGIPQAQEPGQQQEAVPAGTPGEEGQPQ